MSNYNKLIDRYDRLFLYHIQKMISSFNKPIRKFYIDIIYGMLKSKSVVLSDIAHSLNEKVLLKKTIERLSKFLNEEIDEKLRILYYKHNLNLMPKDSLKMFLVDDTDVIKPYGKHFESMGRVKDGSAIENKPELHYLLIDLSKNLKDEDSYLKFYQLISGINTLLGYKEMGIKNKEKVEHRQKVKQLTLF